MAERKRRTQQELFMDTLSQLAKPGTLIANSKLREKLNWDEAKYKRIKSDLEDSISIIVGRGQGGTVGLPEPKQRKALKMFVSYSHVDEYINKELLKHLEPLRRLNLISDWHDRKIDAGDNWGEKIDEELNKADIILLLVSIDFLNSKYCYDIELERAMERHDNEDAVVIPVILRSCMWQGSPFSKLQALPKDAKAVTSWDDQDDALTNIAEGIRVVAERMISVTVG